MSDTNRLDFLETHRGLWWGWSVELEGETVSIAQCTKGYHGIGWQAPTLREAIDKAMSCGTTMEKK